MEIIYICLLAFTVLIIIIQIITLSSLRKKIKEQSTKTYSLEDENRELRKEKTTLAKYKSCIDADAYALKVRSDADAYVSNVKEKINYEKSNSEKESQRIHSNALSEKYEILKSAKAQASEIVDEAKASQITASQHAAEIIEEAKNKAKSIAGDAYKIAENVEKYRKEAAALRNIIDGYGDRYIKPSDSVLDGLAEEFGFTEAGRELARTRALCKEMIENGMAADSEYVEPYRRQTAIAFILDAFNGKVDSILSTVKTNNYGTLERKINDAATIVNRLGSAFRNTRITPAYLQERLNELKWAVAVVVLKQRQKEEQKAIKDRIREEEKARREYEKAIRESQKQEALIKAAIEKALQQMEKANEDQRKKYEERLSDLQLQLQEAEERNQRALSMAQQTRSGHVYIISNIGSFGEEVFKIGMTRRLDPLDRVRELGDASVPFPFDVHAMIYSDDAPSLETELHKIFAKNQVNKVNPRKEFFRIPLAEIKEYIGKKNMEVQWTLLAEAAQYRESKALEESFKRNAEIEKEWEKKQQSSFDEFENEDEDIDEIA